MDEVRFSSFQTLLDACGYKKEVHGRWIKKEDDTRYWYECSECESRVPHSPWGHDWFSAFCPSCGCKMDADEMEGE